MKKSTAKFLAVAGLAMTLGSTAAWAQEDIDEMPAEESAEYDPGDTSEQPDQQDGEASSGGNIEASVDTIEMLINLPRTAQLGRESDEDLSRPGNVFADEAARKALLEDTPRFIYFPAGSDPMIIPWVRNQVVAAELLADATALLSRANNAKDPALATQAMEMAQEIIDKYPDTQEVASASDLTSKARNLVIALTSGDPNNEPRLPDPGGDVTLPPWVSNNTTGVLIDRENPRNSLVLLGDDIMKVGDKVRRFPTVTIKQVLPEQVIYDYQGREFLVAVKSQ